MCLFDHVFVAGTVASFWWFTSARLTSFISCFLTGAIQVPAWECLWFASIALLVLSPSGHAVHFTLLHLSHVQVVWYLVHWVSWPTLVLGYRVPGGH